MTDKPSARSQVLLNRHLSECPYCKAANPCYDGNQLYERVEREKEREANGKNQS